MDPQRRTLMSEGPIGNALPSAIPVPSSAMKKSAQRLGSSRMSMIPQQAVRSSVMSSTGAEGGMALRHSASQEALGGGARRSTLLPSRGANANSNGGGAVEGGGMLLSVSKPDGGIYGRTPQSNRIVPGSVRRSSVYPSSRTSMAPGAFNPTTKDTRPIRDSTFRQQCSKNINDFLLSVRCPIPLHAKSLTSPTTKEFHQIFRFLIMEFLDPNYQWGKKVEDDMMSILKDMRYPAMETIGKTAITAPGTGMNWPPLLAMLNWLVELCKALDNWGEPDVVSDIILTPASELSIDHPNFEERLLWDFSSKTYSLWFHGAQEDFTEQEREMEEVYEQLASATFEECERLETDIQKRTVELQQLQAAEPPLKRVEQEYIQLMGDKSKFIAFIKLHEQKAEKMRIGNERARAAISDHERQLDAIRVELANTEAAVAAQNLSPDEVQRMNNDRETLSRHLDELRGKIAEASQFAYDQEMQVTKSMDRFDQLLQDYTALGHQIGVIAPLSDAPSLGPGGVDYSIDLDLGVEDLNEVQVSGRRMRSTLWPALQVYGEGFRKQALEMDNASIALDDQLDRLAQAVERQKEEVANREMKLKVSHEQAEEARAQVQTEAAETNRTIAKLENEVTAMSTATQQGVLTTQSQLESTKIAFKELRHKTALLQDAVVAQLTSHIDVIIKAKEHAANSLRSIRAFAEAQ
ncbi:HEC/Ndc80p family-domain-containing protein [Naematelia encephala]|uniref:Kinetochore protein NDC80 n=1 Tax=Naematelia encephala TaxID=71784 RepID=A0A1Y2AIP5_9TREE|nr:HEC/Ndc80p family-domain-containing protein [Naematelia encephala]